MIISNINYRETYFLKPDLSPIIGKPTFESLYQLIVDLQANAQSVHSNLGGGEHGHLGLVMTPTQCAIHSTTLYDRPTHPGNLTIPVGTTRLAAEEMERNRIFTCLPRITRSRIDSHPTASHGNRQQMPHCLQEPCNRPIQWNLSADNSTLTYYLWKNCPGTTHHLRSRSH